MNFEFTRKTTLRSSRWFSKLDLPKKEKRCEWSNDYLLWCILSSVIEYGMWEQCLLNNIKSTNLMQILFEVIWYGKFFGENIIFHWAMNQSQRWNPVNWGYIIVCKSYKGERCWLLEMVIVLFSFERTAILLLLFDYNAKIRFKIRTSLDHIH